MRKKRAAITMAVEGPEKKNNVDEMLLSDARKGSFYHHSSNDLFRYVLMHNCIPTLSIH
jgi:hypothetical protein